MMSETEELLASEFNSLPIHEQAKAKNDKYGAGGPASLKENALIIDWLLTDFEQEVERGQYSIYQAALKQDRSYVEDTAFRLMFLRANMYDVKTAVKQMIAFLHQKVEHFGADKLARDITLDDLTLDDLKRMLSGMYHIQDGTDEDGRAIFVDLYGNVAEDVDSQIRIYYYICFNILIPIHSVQMKGIVSIVNTVVKPGKQTNPGLADMRRFFDFVTCLPMKVSAFHLCMQGDSSLHDGAFVKFGVNVMPKYTQTRTCVHHGSPIELQFQLAKYGIPLDTFPVDVYGNRREGIRNVWFYKYLEREGGITRHRRVHQNNNDDSMSADEESIESLSSTSAGEAEEGGDNLVPPRLPYSNQHVLLGKGHNSQNHPGNIAFRKFLREYLDYYDGIPRQSRGRVSRNLALAMVVGGIQFWQKTDDGVWIGTSVQDVQKTISQFFRSARKRIR